jgi:hypothetical protein
VEGAAAAAALEWRRVAAEAELEAAAAAGGRRATVHALVRLAAASPPGSCPEWQGKDPFRIIVGFQDPY